MTTALIREAIFLDYLREKLIAQFPDIDDECLADTLDGECNLRENLAALVRTHQDDRTMVVALKARIQDMQQRSARFETRIEKMRDLVANVMSRAHITKIIEPDFTVSLRSVGPKLVIISEAEIPPAYWIPQPPKLDRQRILESLKSDQSVPGAILEHGSIGLTVRSK